MTTTHRIYIAGPMRTRPRFNFPAFDAAARLLRGFGYHVCNPADRDRDHGFTGDGLTGDENLAGLGFSHRQALAYDLAWICNHATTVVTLPGADRSKGATAETATARALGIPVRDLFSIIQQHGGLTSPIDTTLLTAAGYAADLDQQLAAWDKIAAVADVA